MLCLFGIAFYNGANDNFKGGATLLGSRTADYPTVLGWVTLTTFAGSVTAFFLSRGLLKAFSGAGFVPADVLHEPGFLAATAFGAVATLLVATKAGLPVSTTHGLIGALVGAGFAFAGNGLAVGRILQKFLLPLLISPLLAVAGALLVYPILRRVRGLLGVERESCICVEGRMIPVGARSFPEGEAAAVAVEGTVVPAISASRSGCVERYTGRILGVSAQGVLSVMHFLSAGALSFARGLNDTPKNAALLLSMAVLPAQQSHLTVGLLIALGGIVSARRVAETVSWRITEMNPGQGFTANSIAAFLVIVASRWGVPVSTTHVSCGALFGIGTVTGRAEWKTIRAILGAWIGTLPLAAVLSFLFASVLG